MPKWLLADCWRWIKAHPSVKSLENNGTFNVKLRFIPNHPAAPALHLLLQRLVEELGTDGIPAGFRNPIARGEQRQAQSWRTAETLLANILHLSTTKKDSLAVGLSPSHYSGSELSSSGIINLLKLGEERRLWILKPGVPGFGSFGGKLARLVPYKKFRSLQSEVFASGVGEDISYSEPLDPIRLSDAQGNPVAPHRWRPKNKLTRERLRRIQTVITETNSLLANYTIRSGDRQLFPVLYAVFNRDFEHGGRFYTARGGHTNLPAAKRHAITFHSPSSKPLPSVELDYDGLHVRILYHLSGSEFPHDEDPYGRVLDVLGKDPTAVFEEAPSIRDDLKYMLLAFINGTATAKQQAANANHRLFYGKTEQRRRAVEERIRRWRKAGLLQMPNGKPSAEHVLEAFRSAHEPIRKSFSTGCGLHLQNLDAAMALAILEDLTKAEIPTLPVHDSFIVPKGSERKLRQAMENAYRSVLRERTTKDTRFSIPINQKLAN